MCFILLFTSVQHTRGCTDLHTACIQLRRPVCIRHGWKTMRSTRKSTRAVFPIFVMGRDHTSTRGLLQEEGPGMAHRIRPAVGARVASPINPNPTKCPNPKKQRPKISWPGLHFDKTICYTVIFLGCPKRFRIIMIDC